MPRSSPILLVDSAPRARSAARVGLERAGFEVEEAANGEEAMEKLAGGAAPALIISEAELEGIDGFGLCEQARNIERGARVPFLLLSRLGSSLHGELAREVGADDLLQKPLFIKDLATLSQLYAGREALQSSLTGSLDQTRLHYLLRALTVGGRSGRIAVAGGSLTLAEGAVVAAEYGGLEGEKALRRMLFVADGGFVLSFGPPAASDRMLATARELAETLFDRVREFDEARGLLPPLGSVMQVDYAALTRSLADLPRGVEHIVRLLDGKRSLRQVIEVSDFDELVALKALARLSALAILRPPGASPRVRLWAASVPASRSSDAAQATLLPRVADLPPAQPLAPAPLPTVAPIPPAARETSAPAGDAALEEVFFTPPAVPEEASGAIRAAPMSVPSARWRWGLAATAALGLALVGYAALSRRQGEAVALEVPQLDPSHAEEILRAQAAQALTLGRALYKVGNVAAAIPLLEEAAAKSPANGSALVELALARFDAGDGRGAIEAAQRALRIDPSNARALLLMATAKQTAGDLAGARLAYQKYLEAEPQGANAEDVRAVLRQLSE